MVQQMDLSAHLDVWSCIAAEGDKSNEMSHVQFALLTPNLAD
jgi:hypothetical protein